ncbi:MAG: hypothetical protein IJZ13_06385 [Clostridia bacterium]|nr:hypothetical protein [Clostridia bacterium]
METVCILVVTAAVLLVILAALLQAIQCDPIKSEKAHGGFRFSSRAAGWVVALLGALYLFCFFLFWNTEHREWSFMQGAAGMGIFLAATHLLFLLVHRIEWGNRRPSFRKPAPRGRRRHPLRDLRRCALLDAVSVALCALVLLYASWAEKAGA